MSNSSWLPTQKGTELFPKATVRPAKIVVEGLGENAPLYREITEHFSGQLKRFHAVSQQAHALSVNEITKRRAEFNGGDAIATYVNVQGDETIHLWVKPPVAHALKKKIEEHPRPTWAVIEIRPPNIVAANGYWLAKLNVSKPAGSLGDVNLPAEHITAAYGDVSVFSLDDHWFDFAHASASEIDLISPHETVASLLIDLRPYNFLPTIALELYGFLMSQNVQRLVTTGTNFAAATVVTIQGTVLSPGDYNLGVVFTDFREETSGITIGGLIDMYPDLAGQLFTLDAFQTGTGNPKPTYTYDPSTRTLVPAGSLYVGSFYNEVQGIKEYYVPATDVVSGYQDFGPIKSPVHIDLLYLSEPDWERQNYEVTVESTLVPAPHFGYNRWIVGNGSKPLNFVKGGDFNVPVIKDVDAPDYLVDFAPAMPFLGIITIDFDHQSWGLQIPHT